MSGVEEEFFWVKAWQATRQQLAQARLDVVGNDHQITRHHDGLVDCLITHARLDGQRGGGDGRFNALGNTLVKLAGQGNGHIGRDTGHRPAGVKPADSRRGRLERCGKTGLEGGQDKRKRE